MTAPDISRFPYGGITLEEFLESIFDLWIRSLAQKIWFSKDVILLKAN